MSVAWNGTEGVFDAGYSAGVSDMNIFYDVRTSSSHECSLSFPTNTFASPATWPGS